MKPCCGQKQMTDMASDGYWIPPKRVNIFIGAYVMHDGVLFRIAELLDLSSIIGTNLESGSSKHLRIAELAPLADPGTVSPAGKDISEISDKDWSTAQHRYAAIKPLLETPALVRSDVMERAQELNIGATTLYRWYRRYNATGDVSALVPMKRGWRDGHSRIPDFAEEIIQNAIKTVYLNPQRSTVKKVIEEVQRQANALGIKAPDPNTVRARVSRLSDKERLRDRGYAEKARKKYTPVPGVFPGADYPLSVVQIDHTKVDIILVD